LREEQAQQKTNKTTEVKTMNQEKQFEKMIKEMVETFIEGEEMIKNVTQMEEIIQKRREKALEEASKLFVEFVIDAEGLPKMAEEAAAEDDEYRLEYVRDRARSELAKAKVVMEKLTVALLLGWQEADDIKRVEKIKRNLESLLIETERGR
jgi:hypothetical protein